MKLLSQVSMFLGALTYIFHGLNFSAPEHCMYFIGLAIYCALQKDEE